MRYALVLAVVALAVGSAFAVQNPDIRIYLDADPPNMVSRVDPLPNDTFTVSAVLDCHGDGGGSRGTAFKLIRTFTGFKLGQTAMMGGLDFGDAENDGWTVAAGADCVYPDANDIVVVGEIQYLYLGGPGTLTLTPHPGTGRETLDCNFADDDHYCIAGHLGVNADAPAPEEGCVCDDPVDDATWGSIKALYR
jgi:hypothetical protein